MRHGNSKRFHSSEFAVSRSLAFRLKPNARRLQRITNELDTSARQHFADTIQRSGSRGRNTLKFFEPFDRGPANASEIRKLSGS